MTPSELSYILTHLGEERAQYFNAVTPPVIQSTNFIFNTVADMREGLVNELDAPFYTRGYNPTVAILRKKIAALEGTEDCLVFASGSAAMAAAVIGTVKAGDHVICVRKPYSWTNKLLNNLLSKFGVSCSMIDGRTLANFEDEIRPETSLIILESPNSLTFEMQDIRGVCSLARSKGITTIIDNSYASPLYQRPAEMGADLIVHSSSKYLNGHSDVVSGVLCGSHEQIRKIFASELMTLGGIISPHDAWLILRGLRTIQVRMDRSSDSAEKVVDFLSTQPRVQKVLFPFAADNPQLELARSQMKRCGGMFSILLDADMEGVERFCNTLKHFVLACSWGGYESIIFPMCTLYGSLNYHNPDLPYNLIRVYIGLEDPESLIDDLKSALEAIEK